eukprot:TRINITY_DN84_c0_g1_i1.p1 TRINITY_DN84_c0_g1~~TRINITY_DN84_c0_g1_i1.p1  ORF type:complete len:588 (-),score=142.98 TRINITY_DN84_c0_g1_i1:165-1928(-)
MSVVSLLNACGGGGGGGGGPTLPPPAHAVPPVVPELQMKRLAAAAAAASDESSASSPEPEFTTLPPTSAMMPLDEVAPPVSVAELEDRKKALLARALAAASRPPQGAAQGGQQAQAPASLVLSSLKLYRYGRFWMRLTVKESWRKTAGLTVEEVTACGFQARVCRLGVPQEEAICRNCCPTRQVVSVVSAEPMQRLAQGLEQYTFILKSNCTSSRDHLKSQLVMEVRIGDSLCVVSPPFVLRARKKSTKANAEATNSGNTSPRAQIIHRSSAGSSTSSPCGGSEAMDQDAGEPACKRQRTSAPSSPTNSWMALTAALSDLQLQQPQLLLKLAAAAEAASALLPPGSVTPPCTSPSPSSATPSPSSSPSLPCTSPTGSGSRSPTTSPRSSPTTSTTVTPALPIATLPVRPYPLPTTRRTPRETTEPVKQNTIPSSPSPPLTPPTPPCLLPPMSALLAEVAAASKSGGNAREEQHSVQELTVEMPETCWKLLFSHAASLFRCIPGVVSFRYEYRSCSSSSSGAAGVVTLHVTGVNSGSSTSAASDSKANCLPVSQFLQMISLYLSNLLPGFPNLLNLDLLSSSVVRFAN